MNDRIKNLFSGGWESARLRVAVGIALVAFAIWGIVLATGVVSNPLPSIGSESDRSPSASSGSEQTAAVTSNGGAVRYSVVLRGLETPSDVVFVLGDGSRPPNTRCTFEGPSETQVLFDDGTIGPISGVSYGVKTGPVWLLGPAGETAGAVCWTT